MAGREAIEFGLADEATPNEVAEHVMANDHHDPQRPQPEPKPVAAWLLTLGGVGLLATVSSIATGWRGSGSAMR